MRVEVIYLDSLVVENPKIAFTNTLCTKIVVIGRSNSVKIRNQKKPT